MAAQGKLRLGVNIDHVATVRNAAAVPIRTRCAQPAPRKRQALMASPRTCARIDATSPMRISKDCKRC